MGKGWGIGGRFGKGAGNRGDIWEGGGEYTGHLGKGRGIHGTFGKGAGNRGNIWERGGFSVQGRRHDSQVICQ